MRLLRLTADWCGPCKRVAPVVEGLALRHGVQLVTVNVDESPDMVERYAVQSVPTFVVLDADGEAVYTGTGAECIPDLQRALEAL